MSQTLKIALCLMIAGGAAAAQAQTRGNNYGAALKSTCRADYQAHCSGNDPAPPIAAACLAQFYVNLSKNCQTALNAYNNPSTEPSEDQ